jgi:hypothetical protein
MTSSIYISSLTPSSFNANTDLVLAITPVDVSSSVTGYRSVKSTIQSVPSSSYSLYAETASFAISSSNSVVTSSNYADQAGYATASLSCSYAFFSELALTASYALNGGGGTGLTTQPLSVNITGEALRGTGSLNFEVEFSTTESFSPSASYFSTLTNTSSSFRFYNGSSFQPFPSGGLPEQYRDSSFSNVVCTWQSSSIGASYYVRTRGYDGTTWGEYRVAAAPGIKIGGGTSPSSESIYSLITDITMSLSGGLIYTKRDFTVKDSVITYISPTSSVTVCLVTQSFTV